MKSVRAATAAAVTALVCVGCGDPAASEPGWQEEAISARSEGLLPGCTAVTSPFVPINPSLDGDCCFLGVYGVFRAVAGVSWMFCLDTNVWFVNWQGQQFHPSEVISPYALHIGTYQSSQMSTHLNGVLAAYVTFPGGGALYWLKGLDGIWWTETLASSLFLVANNDTQNIYIKRTTENFALPCIGCGFSLGPINYNSHTITIVGLEGNDAISGGDGRDVLWGGDGANQLSGFGGNDELQGRGGNDVMAGGDGDDFFDGGPGNDIAGGGAGVDTQVGVELFIQ